MSEGVSEWVDVNEPRRKGEGSGRKEGKGRTWVLLNKCRGKRPPYFVCRAAFAFERV